MATSNLSLMTFTGLSSVTGQTVSGIAHLTQSLRDIITTPIGTRVMRRDYGSRVPFLLDQPMSRALVADVVAATAEAVSQWEPRIRLARIAVTEMVPGQLSMALIDRDGIRYELGAVQ